MRKTLNRRALAQRLEGRLLFSTASLTAAADSYVRDGSFASSNFGTAAELVVKNSGPDFNREAVLRFDLGATEPNVTSAKLRVYGYLQDTRTSNVLTDVYGAGTGWSESAVTWNNRPAASTAKLATFTVTNTTKRWYEIDLTQYVRSEKSAGRNAVGFVLRNPTTAAPYTGIASKEATNKPVLVVTSDSGGVVLPVISVTASDASASEPGTDKGTFTFSRTGSTATSLAVAYSAGGSAAGGSDYTALSGTVTFPAGAATAVVTVSPVDDAAVESAESVVVTVSGNSAYAVDSSKNTATVTIADNDSPPPTGQSPFAGSPAVVPGVIEVEKFDEGGEGVAYHDTEAAQLGGAYRTNVGVDVESTGDSSRFAIGHVRAGEWLEFTVNVATSGSYDLGIRFASAGGGGTAHLESDGVNVSGPINFPGTGGWQSWQTFTASGIMLSQGSHVLRFAFDASTQGGDIGNVNFLELTKTPAQATPPRWPSSWQSGASALTARFEAAGTVVGSKIFVFGGFKSDFTVHRTHTSYNTATNTWANLGTMPATMAESHQGLAADDRYVYIAGGYGGNLDTSKDPTQWISDKVWRYDTVNNTFIQIATLPQPRGAGALDLLGRELHYFGGNPADRVTNVGDHWVYNLDTATWRSAAAMPDPKDHFSTVVLNGKIYAVGGEHGHDQLHQQERDLDVYDPATDKWTSLASMPIAKSHMESGTFVLDGKIVMAGGQVDNFQPTTNVVAYDPNTNSWTGIAPLPAARQGAVVGAVGNAVYITLGGTQTNSPQSQTWIGQLPAAAPASAALMTTGQALPLDTPPMRAAAVTGAVIGKTSFTVGEDGSIVARDLSSGATRTASPASARPFQSQGSAMVVHKSRLLFLGGTGEAAGKVQIYDTGRNRWKVGRAMPFAASDSAATVQGNKVYLLGGVSPAGEVLASAARYDLARGKWTALADMTLARASASADSDGLNVYLGAGRVRNAAGDLEDVNDISQQILNLQTLTWSAFGVPNRPDHPPVIAGG